MAIPGEGSESATPCEAPAMGLRLRAGARAGSSPDTQVDRSDDDRRRKSRMRGPRRKRDRSTAGPRLLNPQWLLMAPIVMVTAILAGLASGSVPAPVPALCLATAIALCAAAPIFARLEAQLGGTPWLRTPLLGVAVIAPMGLAGHALGGWAAHGSGLPWDVAVAAIAIVLLTAAALNGDRIVVTVFALSALCAGAAVWQGSLVADGLLGLGTVAALMAIGAGRGAVVQAANDRLAREHEQSRAEELLAEYEDSGQGWFWETDRRGQLTYVSRRIASLLGKDQAGLEGRPFTDLFVLDSKALESERTLVFHLSTRSSFQELPVRAATGETEERWWSISGRPVLDPFNNFLGFRGSGTDLTETRKSQQHAVELARFDTLTKLANRFQMSEWLEKILSAPRVEKKACAVFLLDLDRFKQVNDTLGHPAGDALLRQVADRLRTTVGTNGRTGRLGGDEFQVILPGHLGDDELGHLAHRIIETLSHPYSIEGTRVSIGASVGIARCPEHGLTSEELIRNADLALYAAKDGGRGRFHFYAQDLHSDAQERRQLEQDLRDALAGGGLELHYQPQVRTTTEKVTGFEALLRWKHPRIGYISPAKFVPIAEDAGLIPQIGEWALRTACHDVSMWPADVRVAVNVSPLQFANPALPAIVTSALAAAGIAPSRLELEITESIFLGDNAATEAMFASLKGVGVRLALDDFGTGYSSLGYLKNAPFDKIKIDQSFVRGATMPGSRNGAIIASIVSLAEALGMETTAEGVETLDELDLVRMLGCSHIQGFIYEKPLGAAHALKRLEAGLTAVAKGPRSARVARQTMLRKVVIDHDGERYPGTVRNISQSGAMIEGLWNVPKGTEFAVQLADGLTVNATCRWCKEDRMGVEFDRLLSLDATGAVSFTPTRRKRERAEPPGLRKAG